jgi:predicted RNA-binding Zn ribbon-like protein
MTESVTESTDGVPEDVRLVRDFVNTVELQVDQDRFETPDALSEWLAGSGLIRQDSRLGREHLELALAVREGLRSVLMTHAGHAGDPRALDALDAALAEVTLRVAFDAESGRHRLVSTTEDPLHVALAAILGAVHRATEDQTWPRLKVCARDSCRWAFYDASRNRSARWCSMAGCGNHVKMKRAYAARKGRRGAPSS